MSTTIGLAGEHFAAGVILGMTGWAYAQAAQDKIDGVAISKTDNTVLRIQVKTREPKMKLFNHQETQHLYRVIQEVQYSCQTTKAALDP